MSIEKFNAIIDEFAQSMSLAEGQKEQDEIANKFSKLIDSAEKDLEDFFENEIKLADELLSKEQREAESLDDEIDENDIVSDVRLLNKKEFADKYRMSEIIILANSLGIKTSGVREDELVEHIYNFVSEKELN